MKRLKLILAICALLVSITSCKKVDPAPSCTTACNNGGTRNQTCGCDCPAGFTGSHCETRIVTTPPLVLESVTITRIIVNNFPASYSIGQLAYNWDPGTTSSKYPDIYININPGTSSIAAQTSAVYNNVNSAPQTYSFVPVILSNPSNNYCLGLYDYDPSDPDDFMGGIYFRPSDYKTAGYPSTIHLVNSATHIDYTVYVIWNF